MYGATLEDAPLAAAVSIELTFRDDTPARLALGCVLSDRTKPLLLKEAYPPAKPTGYPAVAYW